MIIAGFGMRADVTEASLQDALDQTGYAPDAIATVTDKAEFDVFQAFARTQKLPIQTVSQDSLDHAQTQTQSQASLHHRGTCLLYTSPSPRDATLSRMPSSA